jgi:hypothetical protein
MPVLLDPNDCIPDDWITAAEVASYREKNLILKVNSKVDRLYLVAVIGREHGAVFKCYYPPDAIVTSSAYTYRDNYLIFDNVNDVIIFKLKYPGFIETSQ